MTLRNKLQKVNVYTYIYIYIYICGLFSRLYPNPDLLQKWSLIENMCIKKEIIMNL